jgi:hypothetical protein
MSETLETTIILLLVFLALYGPAVSNSVQLAQHRKKIKELQHKLGIWEDW